MADRRATITLRWARRREPTAMVDVHTTCMAVGMTSPMTSSIRSPGTRVVASPSRHWPPRHTRQEGRREFFRAAMALPAFFSDETDHTVHELQDGEHDEVLPV